LALWVISRGKEEHPFGAFLPYAFEFANCIEENDICDSAKVLKISKFIFFDKKYFFDFIQNSKSGPIYRLQFNWFYEKVQVLDAIRKNYNFEVTFKDAVFSRVHTYVQNFTP